MARQKDAQKFIGSSRAPRVQIEYDVELYGSQKKVELPFVAGVMADLSGDNDAVLGPVEDRRFSEIDDENFDQRMAEIAPALNFYAPNVLTDDGTLIDIDLQFKTMADFEPAQMVKRIPELAIMLEARSQLKELITYMDGKAAAEDVIQELLKNPAWSQAVKIASVPTTGGTAPTDPAPSTSPTEDAPKGTA
jgi:type VI secretion system protein ImpB